MILVRTPYRVSLFGGGTDYPEWFREHSGCSLGFAIRNYCYVGAKFLPPGQEEINYRIGYSRIEDRASIEEIHHPAVRGVLKFLACERQRLEIHHMGDYASGSGLGASSAFVVGLLHALRRLLQLNVSFSCAQHKLAQDAIYVERRVIQETVGCQDQIITALGGMRWTEFFRGDPEEEAHCFHSRDCGVTPDRQSRLVKNLLLVHTGAARLAHEMAAKQLLSIAQNIDHLRSIHDIAMRAQDVLTSSTASLDEIGALLGDTWDAKRHLHHEISSPRIDELYERALKLGALGGKLLGAGGGGFMLFYVPQIAQLHFIDGISAPWARVQVCHRGTHTVINEETT